MIKLPLGVGAGKVRLISDEKYFDILRDLITGAQRYCLASLFIIDLSPLRDRTLQVDSLLCTLRLAMLRGVDVRLVVGGSRTNYDIAALSALAELRAKQLGLPIRWLTRKPQESSHAKLVVIDHYVLTGSHNWSHGAFFRQTQDSLLVQSKDLAAYGVEMFENAWQRAEGE